MPFISFLKIYLLAIPIFFIVDMIWIGVLAKGFYQSQLGDLLTKNINWTAAIAFYLLFLAGLVIFSVAPALEKNSFSTALVYGALFGFFTYITYDLTNLATIKNWPLTLTMVDIVWGTFLASTVASITFMLAKQFNFS
jgi:uncharacterized membrane protein